MVQKVHWREFIGQCPAMPGSRDLLGQCAALVVVGCGTARDRTAQNGTAVRRDGIRARVALREVAVAQETVGQVLEVDIERAVVSLAER
jgi:hypothetical protein